MPTTLSDALQWITELLTELEIPYQVVGGLAARAYGASRPIVDIDLYVPDLAALERIAATAEEYLSRPPRHHRDEHWDRDRAEPMSKIFFYGLFMRAHGDPDYAHGGRRVCGRRRRPPA